MFVLLVPPDRLQGQGILQGFGPLPHAIIVSPFCSHGLLHHQSSLPILTERLHTEVLPMLFIIIVMVVVVVLPLLLIVLSKLHRLNPLLVHNRGGP